jgi:DNA-binding MarR family transcriptional regulator
MLGPIVTVLDLIIESGPMTQKALGTALRIDRTTMVALVDDLEARGLAERRRHPRDRRAFLVTATPLGREAKAAAIRVLDCQQQRFPAPLSQQDRLLLADLLRRLYHGQQDPDPSRPRRTRSPASQAGTWLACP